MHRIPTRFALAAGLGALLAFGCAKADRPPAVDEPSPVGAYPRTTEGEWVRGPNLMGPNGELQPRQEHAVIALNGFVYVINGFVPKAPPPEPSEDDPAPDLFEPTNTMMVYAPAGPTLGLRGQEAPVGQWRHLNARFPEPTHHHIIAVAHEGRIWAFGGHAKRFEPTQHVYVFTPTGPGEPDGSWSAVRIEDGAAAAPGAPGAPGEEPALALPVARAAGSAVSLNGGIYIMGGVVPNEAPHDPVNEAIRADASVLFLDTGRFPLRWEDAPAMHEPREHFTAVVVRERIYALQGRNERSTRMRGVESWAPGDGAWFREQSAPIGASANVVAAVNDRIYSFGGEFVATTHTGTVDAAQVFDATTGAWQLLESQVRRQPLDASQATRLHGLFGVAYEEGGAIRIMAPGGGDAAWIAPTARVHIFDPGEPGVAGWRQGLRRR